MIAFPRILAALEESGLLLLSDVVLPSAVGLVGGGPVRGSWWAHPCAHEIFRLTRQLEHHPDVTVAKLLSGKVLYVHRSLWPALVAVGSARDPGR
ncbi:MAG: hypothetical protein ACE5JI_02455 [Acidobacteriota bacterium]